MRTIHKYQLIAETSQTIHMPAGTKILTVREQHDNICIWAEVETTFPLTKRTFYIFGTGEPIPDDLSITYLGTAILMRGNLVMHVYETEQI